jgi:excinuclease ABC subunit C
MEQIIVNLNLSPDLLIVDGGKGQLGVAEKVIDYFKIRLPLSKLPIDLLGIAKGQARKFGLEKIYLASDGSELHLQSTHQVFKLLLRVRDEAHRFAISSHRKKRDKAI